MLTIGRGMNVGMPIGGGRGISFPGNFGYDNPVLSTALTTPADGHSSILFNADGVEVLGAELQTNPGMTGTEGTSGGGGDFTNAVFATTWRGYAAAGRVVIASKEAVTDDQIISVTGGVLTFYELNNPVSFTADLFYQAEVLVSKIVGACSVGVRKSDGTNIQATNFSLLPGINKFWFKALYTATGTLYLAIPDGGSITIRTASIKQKTSPLNCLRASINTGSGVASLVRRRSAEATWEDVLISAAVPTMNKNYAPTGCCTDPDWDLDVTTGWGNGSNPPLFESATGGRTSNCLLLTENSTGTSQSVNTIDITVKPGETYNFSGYVKAGTEATYRVRVYDKTNAAILLLTTAAEASDDWETKWDFNVTIPAGCFTVYVTLFQICVNGSGTTIFFDDVSFTKTSTDDLVVVVDKAADGASSSVSLFHDGVKVGASQMIEDAAILAGKNHYLAGDYGSSILKKRRFTLGPELSSGTTAVNKAYKITATQANYFFTGCAIGNIFTAPVEKTFDANNKAKEVLLP